jgi:DNA processing protein
MLAAHDALTLLGLRGLGPQAVARLGDRFSSLAEAVEAGDEALHGAVTAQGRASLRDRSAVEGALDRAREQMEQAQGLGVAVLSAADEAYPEWLRLLPDRPPVLYVRGALRPGRRYVACIGTREPSEWGRTVTARITRELAAAGWSIVSGLALGVDSIAHRAALEVGAHTVAVLGNGLSTLYPKANKGLAEDVVASGGALMSELPMAAPVLPRNLVQRDRLQCGMSAGTVVHQTDVKGGSMHTVRFTLLQGRLLFAPVPTRAPAVEEKSRGILALTQLPGRELARLLGASASEEYGALLRQLGDTPAAVGIRTRDDYPKLLAALEAAAGGGRSPGPVRDSVQMGLSL